MKGNVHMHRSVQHFPTTNTITQWYNYYLTTVRDSTFILLWQRGENLVGGL